MTLSGGLFKSGNSYYSNVSLTSLPKGIVVTTETAVPMASRGMKRQVIKHVSAIQIGSTDGDITLVQRKAYNVLLAHAYDDLMKKPVHSMPISELCRYLSFESNNTKHLKDALRGLVGVKVEWNVLGADRQHTWGVAALLSEVRIADGFCFWEYSSTIRSLLYSPSIYSRINLSLQNKFSSKHSLILYENVFHYFRKSDGFGETPWIEVLELRKLFGIRKTEYKQFKIFNNSIIKKSVEEINQVTDLVVTVEYRKKGRSVAAIKFYINLNRNTQEIAAGPTADSAALIQQLVNTYGIDNGQAKQLVEKYDAARIAGNLAIVDQDQKDGKVKGNLAGYAIKAIQSDFRKDRKPAEKPIPIYGGMRVLYNNKEYVVDSSLTIRFSDGVMPQGTIIQHIKSGAMRVFELTLLPDMQLLISNKIRTVTNKGGCLVVNEDGLFLTEAEIVDGIKSRNYLIHKYPEF